MESLLDVVHLCLDLVKGRIMNWTKMAVTPAIKERAAGSLLGRSCFGSRPSNGYKTDFWQGNTRMEASIAL